VQHTDDQTQILRQEVAILRAQESRRVFDVAIHVGELGGRRDSFVRTQDTASIDIAAMDIGLRIDVVSSLVGTSAPEAVSAWVSRPGAPHTHDVDLEWLAAASVAFGMHGRELAGFYAITRSGWLDVRTGEQRVWKRLRL